MQTRCTPVENRLEQLRRLAQRNPNNPLGQYTLGVELDRAGDWEGAAEALRRAVALNPDYTAAYRDLGRVLAKAGRPAEARSTYEAGLQSAERTGELQTAREIQVFLRRLGEG